MKRKIFNGVGVLDNMLKSVGIRNMIMDDSDESEDSDDIKFDVDWVERVVSNIEHSRTLEQCKFVLKTGKKT